MSVLALRSIARALGGEVTAGKVIAPAPGHSSRDRSLWVIPSWQAPDGFRVHCFSPGDDWREARDYVRAKLGIDPDGWKRQRPSVYNIHDPSDHAVRIARAARIWDDAGDTRGTVVQTYLQSRGIELPDGTDVLRFHPRCPWRDEEAGRTIFVPAMIAAMRAIDGDAITGIHRTRLTDAGAKVDRRMLGIAAGAAVKLDDDDAVTMGLAIGEGVETCQAARQLGFRPAWALGSAGAIAAFPVLPGVEALTILAENDPTNAKAVEACARRWHAAGREVIVIEPKIGSDMNDALRGAA